MILASSLLKLLAYPLSVKSSLGHTCSRWTLNAVTFLSWLVTLGIGLVFGAGSVLVFYTFQPEYSAGPFGFELYCKAELFWFAFVTAVVAWVLITIWMLIAAVNFVFLICFGISKE